MKKGIRLARLLAMAMVALGAGILVPAGHTNVPTTYAAAPYTNPTYWPQWTPSPMGTPSVWNCTTYDLATGVGAWNATGLVSLGAPQPRAFCSTSLTWSVWAAYGTDAQFCGVCQGFVRNYTAVVYPDERNPESQQPQISMIFESEVRLKPFTQLGATTVPHELGHTIGLTDQYAYDAYGNPTCSGGPPSVMDICGYTTPQTQDTNWVNTLYRILPFAPDNVASSAPQFNKATLSWVDRSHNEKQFSIWRSFAGLGQYYPDAIVTSESLTWQESAPPNSFRCYQIRSEGWYGGVSPWRGGGCLTTPDAVGTPISGVFSGSTASLCIPNAVGAGLTYYRIEGIHYHADTGIVETHAFLGGINASCYGISLWQGTLPDGAWHFGVKGCNNDGCSQVRDMTNPNQSWTWMPGGASGGGTGNANYHTH